VQSSCEVMCFCMRGAPPLLSHAEDTTEAEKAESISTNEEILNKATLPHPPSSSSSSSSSSGPCLPDSSAPSPALSKKRKRNGEAEGDVGLERKKPSLSISKKGLVPLSKMPTKVIELFVLSQGSGISYGFFQVDAMSFDSEGGRVWVTPQLYSQAIREIQPNVVFAMAAETEFSSKVVKKRTSVDRSLLWLDQLSALLHNEMQPVC
jgi:hypothetical protein